MIGRDEVKRSSEGMKDTEVVPPISVKFEWEAGPKESWGGLSKTEIQELVTEAGDFFHISAEKRKMIHILFGDHAEISIDERRKKIGTATHIARFDNQDEISESDIVINRSLELAAVSVEEPERRSTSSTSTLEVEAGSIQCDLDEPWESVAWLIAEEIHHAAFELRLSNLSKIEAAEKKYREYAMAYHKNELENASAFDDYSLDIEELAASRQVLRFLEYVASRKNPTRAPFFRQLYETSLQERKVVIARHWLDKKSAFIKTGYKQEDDERKVSNYLAHFFEIT